MANCLVCSKEVSTFLYIRLKSGDDTLGFVGIRLPEDHLRLYRAQAPQYLPSLAGATHDLSIRRARAQREGKTALVEQLDAVMPVREAQAEAHCRGHELEEVATAAVKVGRFPLTLLWNPGRMVLPMLKTPSPQPQTLIRGLRIAIAKNPESVQDALGQLLEVSA